MKRDEIFPSKYLKAADLKGKPIAVIIERAQLEMLKGSDGKDQANIVQLFPDKTHMAVRTVDCVRIRAPAQREPSKPKPVEPKPLPDDDMDDEVPF